MKNTKLCKAISLVLAVVMIASLFSFSAIAQDNGGDSDLPKVTETPDPAGPTEGDEFPFESEEPKVSESPVVSESPAVSEPPVVSESPAVSEPPVVSASIDGNGDSNLIPKPSEHVKQKTIDTAKYTVEHWMRNGSAGYDLCLTETASLPSGELTQESVMAQKESKIISTENTLGRGPDKYIYYIYKKAEAISDADGAWTLKLYYNAVRFFINTNEIAGGTEGGTFTAGLAGIIQNVTLDETEYRDAAGTRGQYAGEVNSFSHNVKNYIAQEPDQAAITSALERSGIEYNPDTQHIVWYTLHEGTFVHVDGRIYNNDVTVTYHPTFTSEYENKENISKFTYKTPSLNEEQVFQSHTVRDYTATELPENVKGYTFKGWATSEKDALDGKVAYAANSEILRVSRNYDLYAVWEADKVKVTVNLNVRDLADSTEGTLANVGSNFELAETKDFSVAAINGAADFLNTKFANAGFENSVFFGRSGSGSFSLGNTSYLGMNFNGKEYGSESIGSSNDSAIFVNGKGYSSSLSAKALTEIMMADEDGEITIDYYFGQLVHYSVDYGFDKNYSNQTDVNQIFATRTKAGVELYSALTDPDGFFDFKGWTLNGEPYSFSGDRQSLTVNPFSLDNKALVKSITGSDGITRLWFSFESQWEKNSTAAEGGRLTISKTAVDENGNVLKGSFTFSVTGQDVFSSPVNRNVTVEAGNSRNISLPFGSYTVVEAGVASITGYTYIGTTYNDQDSCSVILNAENSAASVAVVNSYSANEYGYTVNYYYNGVINDNFTEQFTAAFGTVINSYPDKANGYVLSRAEGLPLTIGADESENVIDVYYVSAPVFPTQYSLTVNWIALDEDGQRTLETKNTTHPGGYRYDESAAINSVFDGYEYYEYNGSLTGTLNGNTVINVYYTPVVDIPEESVPGEDVPPDEPTDQPTDDPIDIPDDPVPEAPDPILPVGPDDGTVDIEDDDVPLGDLPSTGDTSHAVILVAVMLLSLCGICTVIFWKKEQKN